MAHRRRGVIPHGDAQKIATPRRVICTGRYPWTGTLGYAQGHRTSVAFVTPSHPPGRPLATVRSDISESQNMRTRLPTEGYASTIARALPCLPPHLTHTQRHYGQQRLRGEAMDMANSESPKVSDTPRKPILSPASTALPQASKTSTKVPTASARYRCMTASSLCCWYWTHTRFLMDTTQHTLVRAHEECLSAQTSARRALGGSFDTIMGRLGRRQGSRPGDASPPPARGHGLLGGSHATLNGPGAHVCLAAPA